MFNYHILHEWKRQLQYNDGYNRCFKRHIYKSYRKFRAIKKSRRILKVLFFFAKQVRYCDKCIYCRKTAFYITFVNVKYDDKAKVLFTLFIDAKIVKCSKLALGLNGKWIMYFASETIIFRKTKCIQFSWIEKWMITCLRWLQIVTSYVKFKSH